MSTLKGIWKLKDVPTAPTGILSESISFTFKGTHEGDEAATFICDRMAVYNTPEIRYTIGDVEYNGTSEYLGSDQLVYSADGWYGASSGRDYQTITFTEEQEVSDEFYAWFTANAADAAPKKISGSWEFNSSPTLTSIEEEVRYTVNSTISDVYHTLNCYKLAVNGGGIIYHYDSATPEIATELPYWVHPYTVSDTLGIWRTDLYGTGIKTITFTGEQEVSAEFYAWLTANAVESEPVLPEEPDEPEKVKISGSWEFKSQPTLTSIEEEVRYTVNSTISDVYHTLNCYKLAVNGGGIIYHYDSATPEMDTELPYWVHPYTVSDTLGIWRTDLYGSGIKTITFTGEQEVSAEFYAWFTANAVESEPVLPEEPEKTLSGTWRLNDVLTLPAVGQLVSFTSHLEVADRGWDFDIICSAMVSGGDSGVYYRVTSTSDDAPEDAFAGFPIEIPVYSESGWSTSSYGSGIKTVTFTGEQVVSDEFYAWFTANASETDGGGDDEDDGTDTPVDPTPPEEPDYPDRPTADTIIAKIKSLIARANEVTGKADRDLTDGINSLAEGYGVGGEPVLQEKTVTENGVVTADDGYDGLSKVTVNVENEVGETVPVYDGRVEVV